MNKIIIFSILFAFAYSISYAADNATFPPDKNGSDTVAYADTCPVPSYTIGFFNGMNNTQEKAHSNMKAMEKIHKNAYKRSTIEYQLFYNTTQNTEWDIVETIVQRRAEKDGSYDFKKHYEYIWELAYTSKIDVTIAKMSGYVNVKARSKNF